MLPNIKTPAIATIAALSITLGAAAPAKALGRNERNFLTGVAATLLIGALINSQNRTRAVAPPPAPAPHRATPPHYVPPYEQPATGRVVGSSSSIYTTNAARAFNSLSSAERRTVQSRLRAYGYYAGGIDGAFGPGTYNAMVSYARDTQGESQLSTIAGTYGLIDSLLA